ncbi:ABC transporter permease [Clostridium aciditolerans]|uniref:ABC transporter permease n=1 Tax=Clostridium aciditolerans TaxID=339861 RepID=A0A934HZK5_9CLOT|nr:ABC transporter permease [Clostridium aciditolerans]MBI6873638.1 ABC transporter permease [Clostridium aciditolerans]
MFASLRIAWRFLKDSKAQTMIIILGIAIGVSVQIFIGLLSKGLETTLLNKFIGNSPHITVYFAKGGMEDWQSKKSKIKVVSKDIDVVAPVAEQQAFIKLTDIKEPARIRGFIPEDLNKLYGIKSKIYEGKMIENNGQALIGKELKERLDLKLGDKLNIVTIDKRNIELTIVGFYDLESAGLNRFWIFTDLKTAQDLIGFGDKVTSIEIGVVNPYLADSLSKKVSNSLNDKDIKVQNWKDENKLLLSGIIGQKICTVIIQFFVLLAAVLSIVSVLGITVTQKYKQIGILKAMGIRDGSAAFIFLMQAFVLGIIGTALGVGLAMMYIKGFNTYIVTTEGKPVVDIVIDNKFIIVSALIDIAASTLAAFLPAVKTYRLSPVEIIKNGN